MIAKSARSLDTNIAMINLNASTPICFAMGTTTAKMNQMKKNQGAERNIVINIQLHRFLALINTQTLQSAPHFAMILLNVLTE